MNFKKILIALAMGRVNTIKKQKMILRIRKEVRGTVEQEILYGS